MSSPESYPFLRISKRHHLDYGLVLRCAQWFRTTDKMSDEIRALEGHREFWWDLTDAIKTMKLIQWGEIDWMTGEPLAS